MVTRRIWEAAKAQNLPRAIVINKIDAPDVDLEGLVERIEALEENEREKLLDMISKYLPEEKPKPKVNYRKRKTG